MGVKGGRRVRQTTSSPSVGRLSRENMGASTSHNPMGLHGMLRDTFTFYLWNMCINFPLLTVQEDNVFTLQIYWWCNLRKPQLSSTSINDDGYVQVGNAVCCSLFIQTWKMKLILLARKWSRDKRCSLPFFLNLKVRARDGVERTHISQACFFHSRFCIECLIKGEEFLD
jgi:hypothetical protein